MDLEQRILALEKRIEDLEKKLSKKEVVETKKRKTAVKNAISLDMAKREFIDSLPETRTDPFTDFELVFWASYVLSKTPRKEKLESFSEVGKRSKKLAPVITFFKDKYCQGLDEKAADAKARNVTKKYLQVFLSGNETKYKKNFYSATSDWAVNGYGQNLDIAIKIDSLPDFSLDDLDEVDTDG